MDQLSTAAVRASMRPCSEWVAYHSAQCHMWSVPALVECVLDLRVLYAYVYLLVLHYLLVIHRYHARGCTSHSECMVGGPGCGGERSQPLRDLRWEQWVRCRECSGVSTCTQLYEPPPLSTAHQMLRILVPPLHNHAFARACVVGRGPRYPTILDPT
jgi:hypothetical protein